MRILMISDVYFPRVNGVSTSIKTFRKAMSDLGHEVTVIAPAYGAHEEKHEWLYRIPSRNLPLDPEDRMMKRKYLHVLYDTLRKQNYDIVHIQTPFVAHKAGVEMSRILNLPRVESYHTHFEECLYHYLPFIPKFVVQFSTRWFNRRQCHEVDGLIVPSHAINDLLKNQGIKTPIEIIATGLDEDIFMPGDGDRFRRQYGIGDDRRVLVHIGRVAHEKNIDFLLRVLVVVRNTVPDILLIIAGEGPAENHLRDLAKTLKLDDNVLFAGYLDRTTILLDCYSAGNVFVFSSKIETQGLVLLEAMAQGVPVVSVSALGANDILQGNKGALIAEEQVDNFANKVITLLYDRELHSRLSEEGKLFARTWSARDFALKTVTFYENVINNYSLASGRKNTISPVRSQIFNVP